MIRLLIIADDFTGALDTGVQFAVCGAKTQVVTSWENSLLPDESDCCVLVVDAETRHLTASVAYRIVENIVQCAVKASVPYIYKKTDSALRGNVGAELTALLNASGAKQLPFLPAFPQMNRNTIGGIHYIGDSPVAESVFGADPFEPVRDSCVETLLHRQSEVPVVSCSAVRSGAEVPQQEGIVVFDASSVEELYQTGRALLTEGRLSIMAGCAGFAAVIPELLGLTGNSPKTLPQMDSRLLVVCGSINPISVSQLDYAESHGFYRFRLTPEQKLNREYWLDEVGQQELGRLRELIQQHSYLIVDANDGTGNSSTEERAAKNHMSNSEIRLAVTYTIGYLVSKLLEDTSVGTLMITGGDTLLCCMEGIGVRQIEPLQEMERGVVLSRFLYRGKSHYVISKSGGFGNEDLLPRLAGQLTQ